MKTIKFQIFRLILLCGLQESNGLLFGPRRWIPLQIPLPNRATTTTVAPGGVAGVIPNECSVLARGCTSLTDCSGTGRNAVCNLANAAPNVPPTRCYWPVPPTDPTCVRRQGVPDCRCGNECPSITGCVPATGCTNGQCPAAAQLVRCYWPPPGTTCGRLTGIQNCGCENA